MHRLAILVACFSISCAPPPQYNVVIRHGTVYDGTGAPGVVEDLAIHGDRIVARGALPSAQGRQEVDATGLAVAPGFIDMLNHAETSLIEDGRSQSGIRQGVTLSVFGESSMGPLSDRMKREMKARQGEIKFDYTWTTLGEYLDSLVTRGVSTNVASFVSASTVRAHEVGLDNRPPTAEELDRMRAHVRLAMSEGAMGLTTALIYTPAVFAKTDELVELAKVASEAGGMYISHMRSEGNRLLEAVDETLTIARQARIRAEIYHLKAAGQSNWKKLGDVLAKIEAARKEGLEITADMYTYTAGSTGLDASMPPWVQEGGYDKWAARLRDATIRDRVRREMTTPSDEWENLLLGGRRRWDAARRVQERSAADLHGQDARRGREAARQIDPGHGDGSRRRGRQPGAGCLLPDVGGKRQVADHGAVGEFRLRRLVDGAGRRVPENEHPPTRLRQLRTPPRQVRAR